MKRLITGLLAIALLVAGCGGLPAPASEDNAGGGGAAQPSQLVIANSAELNGLDPAVRLSTFNARVTSQIFEPLFRLSDKGELEGVLATGYKNIDPTTWEFTLRKGVKFQDGTDWNAQAFADNLQRWFDPNIESNVSSAIPAVEPDKTEIVDDYTVRVHTKQPDAVLPHRFAHYWLSFESPAVFKGHDEGYVQQHPVGTGPYRFVEWKKDDHITLKAFDGYWGGKPAIDELTFKPLPDPQSRVAALLSGEADLVVDLPTEAIDQVKNNPDTEFVAAPTGTMEYNLYADGRKGGPLSDPRVLLALNYAVDRQELIKRILAGQAVATQSVVTPQAFGFNDQLEPYPYDLEKAKSLLKEAGYGNGFTTNLWYAPGSSPNDEEVVQAIQGYFAKIGVTVNLKPQEFTTYLSQALAGKLDGLFFIGKTNQIMDGDGILTDSAPGTPWGQYNPLDGQALELWKQEQQAFDDAQRADLLKQIQQVLHDAPHWVYLYQMNQLYGVSKRVQGWKPRADVLLDFTGVTVSDK